MNAYVVESGSLPDITFYDIGGRLISDVKWGECKVHSKKKRAVESYRAALKSLIKECEAALKEEPEIYEAAIW